MNKEKIKIVFMGTSWLSKEVLSSLIEEKYNIAAVFTQPDKKIGRKQEIKPGPIKELSEIKKIKLFQPAKINEEAIEEIRNINPDLIVVFAYGKIIPKEVLEIPKFKCINIHPSLLPKFRGPSPIQNAILAGEKETGITIMLMDEKVDHGDILSQIKVPIDPEDTTETFTKKIIPLSSKLLSETILKWAEGKIKPQKQDESNASYCQLIEREDGHIFWDLEAREIYDKFRAFQPWPGIFTGWENENGISRLKLKKISIDEKDVEKHEIGEVFKLDEKIAVKTSKGSVILEEIQLEGKKAANIKEFVNGHKDFVGNILK